MAMRSRLFPTYFLLLLPAILLIACNDEDESKPPLELVSVFVGPHEINLSGVANQGIPADLNITLIFSSPVDKNSAVASVRLIDGSQDEVSIAVSVLADGHTVVIDPDEFLRPKNLYTIVIGGGLRGDSGQGFEARQIQFETSLASLAIVSATIGNQDITGAERITDVPLDLSLAMTFSAPVDIASFEQSAALAGITNPSLNYQWSDANKTVLITSATPVVHLARYQFRLTQMLQGAAGESFSGFSKTLYTRAPDSPQFPIISDDELLTLVQQQTFKYFWDFAHPVSGMARERNTTADIVTSGGSGFGIMSMIVGMERKFISREQGLQRMDKILTFLESADRFHGAWPHWMNGQTGDVIPFSANDNGGDLVETSFLVQGLLTFRQYLDANLPEEQALIHRINALWESVEWDWYTRGGQDVLYWHWSPDKQWIMNHAIRGYNEALITYFLAAASPTHPIAASAYHAGWANQGAIRNNKGFYGITLPLGYDYGGPLFFAHYSFLGLDPRNLQDTYANYWMQNVNHTRINHAYAVDNPKNFVGYGDTIWGLTASDNNQGYAAHSPTNDLGVITPTAALSSFPYTPDESMRALKSFYYQLGDRLWGPYGFYDAFNLTEGWTADSYLAIDQGPIIVMIENYRTALLWQLFMSCPEVQVAKAKLGFID